MSASLVVLVFGNRTELYNGGVGSCAQTFQNERLDRIQLFISLMY